MNLSQKLAVIVKLCAVLVASFAGALGRWDIGAFFAAVAILAHLEAFVG